jgi:hypothetical protein
MFVKLCSLGNVWLRCVGFRLLGSDSFIFLIPVLLDRLKRSTVIITVVEGVANSREIEQEFAGCFGAGWRCTVRSISPSQFTMVFLILKRLNALATGGNIWR